MRTRKLGNIKRFSKQRTPTTHSGRKAARMTGSGRKAVKGTRSGKATRNRMPTINAGP